MKAGTRTLQTVAVALGLGVYAFSYAQTGAPEPGTQCRIALPYPAGAFPNCSTQFAAAYDFAFCSLNYIMASASEGAMSEAYRKASVGYARISEALSDASAHRNNTEMAERYFASLKNEQPEFVRTARTYVNTKCNNVEAWHAPVLEQLIARLKRESKGNP